MADLPKPAATPPQSSLQALKAANDTLLAAFEAKLSALTPDERRNYFFKNKDAESVNLVNLLSARVDAIRNPADRKAFFMAHPELEIRYSASNFK